MGLQPRALEWKLEALRAQEPTGSRGSTCNRVNIRKNLECPYIIDTLQDSVYIGYLKNNSLSLVPLFLTKR